jgi:hypothetical protein
MASMTCQSRYLAFDGRMPDHTGIGRAVSIHRPRAPIRIGIVLILMRPEEIEAKQERAEGSIPPTTTESETP